MKMFSDDSVISAGRTAQTIKYCLTMPINTVKIGRT